MSNRAELMAAIRREVPHRIPYTYEARPETDAKLKAYLGAEPNADLAAHFKCNRFGSLWAALGQGPDLPARRERLAALQKAKGGQFDLWGVHREWVQAGDVRYLEIVEYPLGRAETVADVEAYDWPRIEDVVFPDPPKELDLAGWKTAQDTVTMHMEFLCPFGIPWALMGMEKLMMDMLLNPAVVEAAVAKVEEYTLGLLGEVLRRYPGGLDLIGCGDDYGTQKGLFVSPEQVDHFFMPSLKRHLDLAAGQGVLGYHHCCGAIVPILPAFIKAGVRVLNPVQTSAAGMDPALLKREFGRDLAFHGGIDIQQTLVTGTPDDVRAEVRHRIETLGPNGYILAPSHVMQPDAPPVNIVAMYEEVQSYGANPGRLG